MMKRVGLGLLAAVACMAAGAALAGAHSKGGPTYRLVFKVEKGSYGSQLSYAGYSESESDNFSATATYAGITIPSKGDASVKRASQKQEFASDGNGPAFEKVFGDAHCRADLYSDPTLPPLVKGSSTGKKLSLEVELAKSVLAEHATGNTGTDTPCDQDPFVPDGTLALYPASAAHPTNYMPQMLTAKIQVSLTKLRGMKVGGEIKPIPVNSTDNAVQRPASDCAVGDETCTQHLGWHGFVEITRTG